MLPSHGSMLVLSCSHSVHNHMLPLLESQTSDKPQFLLISVYSVPQSNITVQITNIYIRNVKLNE